MKKVIVALLLLSCGGLLYVKLTTGFFPIPLTLRKLAHFFLYSPRDLYEPIVVDNFRFAERGFSRTYALRPKYLDRYELGVITDQPVLPSSFEFGHKGYRFTGSLKLEFLWKNEVLFEQIADHDLAMSYLRGGSKWYKEVYIASFDIPFKGQYSYTRDIGIRVTVLEPDEFLKDKDVKLFIAPSGGE